MVKITAAQSFALWLERHEPKVFEQLLAEAHAHAAPPAQVHGLGDWSSIVSAIGTDLSTAVSDVGNYLSTPSGQSAVSNVIAQYAGTPATASQAQVMGLQTQLAAAGQQAAPVSYAYNAAGQLVPVYTGAMGTPAIAAGIANGTALPATSINGQPGYAINSGMLSSLLPSGSSGLLIVAAILGGAFFLSRRKKAA